MWKVGLVSRNFSRSRKGSLAITSFSRARSSADGFKASQMTIASTAQARAAAMMLQRHEKDDSARVSSGTVTNWPAVAPDPAIPVARPRLASNSLAMAVETRCELAAEKPSPAMIP